MVDVCVMVGLGESVELPTNEYRGNCNALKLLSYFFLKRTVGAHNYSKRSLSLSLPQTHTHTPQPHEV